MSDGSHGHGHEHGGEGGFGIGFVTVSSSRGPSDDEGIGVARRVLDGTDHHLREYRVVEDDVDGIRGVVDELTDDPDTDAVVTSGGTGLTEDDVTVEALRPIFDKEIPGFGEEFRRRSADEIGTAAMLSRATAGVVDGDAVFVLPGSPGGVETGLTLALAELGHILGLARR